MLCNTYILCQLLCHDVSAASTSCLHPGALLGELLKPGDKLVVAYGGRGGTGVVAPSRAAKQARRTAQERRAMVGDLACHDDHAEGCWEI
jgi:hypothetical protein